MRTVNLDTWPDIYAAVELVRREYADWESAQFYREMCPLLVKRCKELEQQLDTLSECVRRRCPKMAAPGAGDKN